jgi:4-hydroxy-tetrahydrodipicolinate synthase
VAIVSPFYYRLSPESVYAYFREIARSTPIDITLYNIPMLASPIDVATVRRLAEEFPRVIGIKDSSGDISQMMRLIAAVRPIRPDFSFLTGWDACLVPMMLAGCDGGVHATAGVVPEVTRTIYDHVKAGRIDAAFAGQQQLAELLETAFRGADFPEGFRIATGLRGFRMGESRQPATEAQRAERNALATTIRSVIERCGVSLGSEKR